MNAYRPAPGDPWSDDQSEVRKLSTRMASLIQERDGHWIWTGARRGKVARWHGEPVVPMIWNQLRYPLGSHEAVWLTCGEYLCVNPDHHEARTRVTK